jgi:hypothetical protein
VQEEVARRLTLLHLDFDVDSDIEINYIDEEEW